MRKRLFLWLGLLACLLFVVIRWPMESRHSINRDGWAAIEKGMTQQQVQKILGLPPGDYRSNKAPQIFRCMTADHWGELSVKGMVSWESDDGLVEVQFDPDGIAIGACFFEPRPQQQFTDKLFRWLGLPR